MEPAALLPWPSDIYALGGHIHEKGGIKKGGFHNLVVAPKNVNPYTFPLHLAMVYSNQVPHKFEQNSLLSYQGFVLKAPLASQALKQAYEENPPENILLDI